MEKNRSHTSSRPRAQYRQLPHGMMKLAATGVPGSGPSTPGPRLCTVPVSSCPITAGVGNGVSSFMTCRSVWHTPHAVTLTSTLSGPGLGDEYLLYLQPRVRSFEHRRPHRASRTFYQRAITPSPELELRIELLLSSVS